MDSGIRSVHLSCPTVRLRCATAHAPHRYYRHNPGDRSKNPCIPTFADGTVRLDRRASAAQVLASFQRVVNAPWQIKFRSRNHSSWLTHWRVGHLIVDASCRFALRAPHPSTLDCRAGPCPSSVGRCSCRNCAAHCRASSSPVRCSGVLTTVQHLQLISDLLSVVEQLCISSSRAVASLYPRIAARACG